MPRNRRNRSSSRSSGSLSSGGERSSGRYRHRRRNTSRSSQSSSDRSTSRKRRNKESSKHNKRSRKRRSSSHSSDRSRSNRRSKNSRKRRSSSSRSSSKSSSSSPKHKSSRLIDLNMEREKNYEFNEAVDDLYKNEQTRRNQIDKLDSEGGGFKPKSFKSSRSTQQSANTKSKFSKEQDHQSAIFGPITSTNLMKEPINELNNAASPAVEFSVVSSNVKSLMHENLFEDTAIKEKRWKLKLLDLLNRI